MKLLKNGDCLEVMKEIPNKSIDLILCDLPYGMLGNSWDYIIPFEPLWEHYKRVIKDNGAVVLFAAQPFTTKLIHSNFKDYKYNWYWLKNKAAGFQYAKYQPLRKVEDICVFYKKMPVYNAQGLKPVNKTISRRRGNKKDTYMAGHGFKEEFTYTQKYTGYPNNVLEFAKDKGYLHPTQKPVELLEYLVKTYTNPGDTVLDNCMGSGSTGVACVNTNRKFIGIELNKDYFDIAKKRIEEAEVINNGIKSEDAKSC